MTDTTAPRLEHLDPALLTTERNVRKDLNLTKDFLRSVKTTGVLVPIVAFPDPLLDGHYRVHMGHRRHAAAVAGELATVPVYIVSQIEAEQSITEQLVENRHREALRPGETAQAFEQLALLGLPATQIAKRTASPIAVVGDAIRVAKNPVASQAMESYQLTITDALVFDEFADDEAAIASLTETVTKSPAQLAHAAQRIRNERHKAAVKAAVLTQITESGITQLEHGPNYNDRSFRTIRSVYTSADCATVVDEETILAEAGDDLRAFADERWNDSVNPWAIGYAVTNWADHGWFVRAYDSSGGATKGPRSEEEKAAQRIARANNQLWAAAREVRIAWVATFLQRRSLPSDFAALPALYFSTNRDAPNGVRELAHELLGITAPQEWPYNGLGIALQDNPAQAQHILLAIGIAALERSWDEKKGWASGSTTLPLYLRQLSVWGYTLSEIEEQVVVPENATA